MSTKLQGSYFIVLHGSYFSCTLCYRGHILVVHSVTNDRVMSEGKNSVKFIKHMVMNENVHILV